MHVGYFIDIQGTILSDLDKSPIDGSIELLKSLKSQNIPYILVTNNTKQVSVELMEELRGKGFCFENFLDPLMVLESIVKDESVYPFGAKQFREVLPKMGFKIESDNPQNILIASDNTFTSDDYAKMIEYVFGGAKLVGMHATSTYVKNSLRYPGVGAILEMIKYATAKEAKIVGKPSKSLYENALKILQKQDSTLEFKDIVMISDDAIGDLCGAKDLGMNTKLVLSGKCKKAEEIESFKQKIDGVYGSVKDILREIS